ncbi:hypothetical protein [Oribacterium sp. NK2B42]|nr:hypothetical protein [Oribacterium sp. NK2B42]
MNQMMKSGAPEIDCRNEKSTKGLSLTGVNESVNEILKTTGFGDIFEM